jgi:hypothetical protein
VNSGISDDFRWSDICLQQLKVLSLRYSDWSTSECWLEHFSTLGCGITGCVVTSNSICTNIMRDDGHCLRCISHIRRFGVNSTIGMATNRQKTVLESPPDRRVYQIYSRNIQHILAHWISFCPKQFEVHVTRWFRCSFPTAWCVSVVVCSISGWQREDDVNEKASSYVTRIEYCAPVTYRFVMQRLSATS